MGKNRDIEGPIHRSILARLERELPDAVVHHSPNEFPGKGPQIERAIAKNKKNGMKPGYPDLVVHHGGKTLAFEVKSEGGKLQDTQKAMLAKLQSQGVLVAVVRSQEDLIEALQDWGIELRGVVT